MKRNNWLWTCGCLIIAIFCFCGCSDDDEVGSSADLIGTWEVYAYQDWVKLNGEIIEEHEDDDDDYRLTFNADGSFSTYYNSGSSWQMDDEGTWQYSGNKLRLYFGDEEYAVTIVELTDSHFAYEEYEKYTEDGDVYEYYTKESYRKIN